MLDFHLSYDLQEQPDAPDAPDELELVEGLELEEHIGLKTLFELVERDCGIAISFFNDALFSLEEVKRVLQVIEEFKSEQTSLSLDNAGQLGFQKLINVFETASSLKSGVAIYCD